MKKLSKEQLDQLVETPDDELLSKFSNFRRATLRKLKKEERKKRKLDEPIGKEFEMKNKQFVEKYKGKDKLRGRPIRLNQVNLKCPDGKRAELVFLGDIHYGHPQCRIDKVKRLVEWGLENNAYFLLMGDLIECGLRDSIGDSVYKQRLNPQQQMEEIVDILQPLADAGLIIGIHEGNHENRITKSTGIDITKIMARLLGVKYLGYACWSLLKINGHSYTMYSTHGSSGSKFKHTKMKAVMDIAAFIDADIIAMGHVHSIAAENIITQTVSLKDKTVVEKKTYVVLTGSYLSWDKSYAQMKNYPVTRLGSPKAKLYKNEKEVRFTL